MTALRLADHCGRMLAERALGDPRIWVLDGDLADSDGAEAFAERHPRRFIAAGIAEQNMVSMAAGMAEAGLRPFVFSFAAFLCYRAYDQIRVGLSQCRQPVVLVGSHSGGLAARNGKTHAALNDLALMLSLPALQVFCPADLADLGFALDQALARGLPAYIRLPRRVVAPGDDLPGHAAPFRWLGTPSPVAIVSTGVATHWAREVAAHLAQRGHALGVLHCLEPGSCELRSALASLSHAIVLEDHQRFGGLSAMVRHLCPQLSVTALGWPENWSGKSGCDQDLLASAGLSFAALSERIAGLVAS